MCISGAPLGEAPGSGAGDAPSGPDAVAGRPAAEDQIYAALDLGTNNCRLLIARPTGCHFRVVDSFSRIVRLGEGIETDRRISDAAMDRTFKALEACTEKLERANATRTRAVATEACRRAENGPAFLERVRSQLELDVETIDGATEADLALAGCAPLFAGSDAEEGLLFDIGGGSTQLIWVALAPDHPPRRLASVSVPCGVVTLTERCGGPDMSDVCYAQLRADIGQIVRPFLVPRATQHMAMVGTSGTVTTLAAVLLGLQRYDRRRVDGIRLSFAEVADAICAVRSMGPEGRVKHPCIGPERATSVLAGCAILEAICAAAPAGSLKVADRGLREGILLGLMAADGLPVAG
ncbi:MAG: Ppx/GppA family phosphatase [Alphaproteobacteria bacterium]|nr:Ppx/GppA family phosphatase [Alphaproteobacteria bacterium]